MKVELKPKSPLTEPAAPFAEASVWNAIGSGWRPLFGSFHNLGFSFEWHDFTPATELDWSRSFHPGSVELCLNLDGRAQLEGKEQAVQLQPQSHVFYFQGNPPLFARRNREEHHRFITIEFSAGFLKENFEKQLENLHPLVSTVVRGAAKDSSVTEPERLPTHFQQLVDSLRHCPVFNPAREIWFRCKALEVATHLFFRPAEGDLFCTRTQRAGRERVEKVRAILKQQLQNPPALEDLGKLVGCSPFYLSRLFSRETGGTIQQYIRQLRLEQAAELLRTGKCNVTEAAFEVGYSSLSHFSAAFHEMFGCCPGLYPLRTATQG